MLFDNVIEQIQASKKEEAEVVIVKLGEVTSVTPGGRAYVKLYGDGSPSTKLYTYIDGYFPEQGDKVALLPQGKTYIILGKVSEKDPIEIYAKIQWVKENFLGLEYKSIIEDASDANEKIRFENYALIPTSDNRDTLGGADNNFKEIFIKKLTLDGESFTKIYQDRILVVNSGTTYSLIATFAAGTITLTPSTNDSWALGTSAAKLKEIWTGLFRGAWKSGQSTERQLSWNSSNALVPDTNESVDLGSSSLHFKDLYIRRVIGAFAHDSTNGYIAWTSATVLAPSVTESIDLGSAAKQFDKIYAKSIFFNGTEFLPDNITVDKLHITYGGANKDLTLSADSSGVHLLPNVNNTFKIGSASYKIAEIFATKFTGDLTGDLTGAIKDGSSYNISFDSSHNLVPSATNAVSLGTSAKQYNKAYVKELYLNGTKLDPSAAVTTNELVDDTGGTTRSLTMTASSNGADIIPSDNNAFNLGSSSYKMKNIYADEIHADLVGDIKNGTYRIEFDNNHNFAPSTASVVNLGAASYQFNKTYTKELYLNGDKLDPESFVTDKLTAKYGTYTRTLTMTASSSGASILPATSNTYDLGSNNMIFKNIYGATLHGDLDGAIKDGNSDVKFDASHNWIPSTTNFMSLGTANKQFKNVYGQNIYVNGTAVSSDKRIKEEIEPLDKRHVEFFKNLKPVTYKYKEGTSGRKHTGFIAQEVEEAIEEAGMTDKDMATVVKDDTELYYLRYEEIIAVQTKVIQDLMARVDILEARVNKLEVERSKT